MLLKEPLYDSKIDLTFIQQAQKLGGVGRHHPQADFRFPLQKTQKGGGHIVFCHCEGCAEAETALFCKMANGIPQMAGVVFHGGSGCFEKKHPRFC